MSEANRTSSKTRSTSTALRRQGLVRRREQRRVRQLRYIRDMTFRHYIRKLLSGMNGVNGSISAAGLDVLASFVKDMFEDLAVQCQQFLRKNNQRTLTHREVQCAVVILLPGELARHALSEAAKALSMYAMN